MRPPQRADLRPLQPPYALSRKKTRTDMTAATHRSEHDLLGDRDVPAEAWSAFVASVKV